MKATTAGMRGSGEAGKQLDPLRARVLRGFLRVAASLLAFASPLPLFPASPLTAQTSLTIYNDGRVLVRRTVQKEIPRGASTQRVGLGPLNPGSIFSLDSSLTIIGVSYD